MIGRWSYQASGKLVSLALGIPYTQQPDCSEGWTSLPTLREVVLSSLSGFSSSVSVFEQIPGRSVSTGVLAEVTASFYVIHAFNDIQGLSIEITCPWVIVFQMQSVPSITI